MYKSALNFNENLCGVKINKKWGFINKKGVMIIEKDNGDKHILDLESNTDISKSDYLDVVDTKKTKENVLFKNIIFDTERLEKLANGGR